MVHKEESTERVAFGFWVYLMTDLVLFASLFAVYAVLQRNTFGGLSGADIFSLPYVLVETLLLLTSSFISGLALQAGRAHKKAAALSLLVVTGVLGAAFVSMELREFAHLIGTGSGPGTSGFLSAYFALVGTHGLHVSVGLLWILIMIVAVAIQGFTPSNMRKLALLNMFWHFLEIVWVFIFTIVYLLGVL